jgi:hypothetical protein
MNKLNPELKRLIQRARQGSTSAPEEAPFGFAARVVASRRRVQNTTFFQELQHTAWAITVVSLAIITLWGLVLVTQRTASAPAPELPSALSFLASNLNP